MRFLRISDNKVYSKMGRFVSHVFLVLAMFVLLFVFEGNVFCESRRISRRETPEPEKKVRSCACAELCKDPQQCKCDEGTLEGSCGDAESGDIIKTGYVIIFFSLAH